MVCPAVPLTEYVEGDVFADAKERKGWAMREEVFCDTAKGVASDFQ